jgi:hypothetical protein
MIARRISSIYMTMELNLPSRYERILLINQSNGSCYPRKVIVLQQMKNFKKWKHSVSYGHRWTAETVFSAIKRMFGEYVMARKYHPNMVKEMFLKVSLYNMFADMKL